MHQVQDLLIQIKNQKQKDVSSCNENQDDKSLVKLNSFYGFLEKEISMKHNIQM